MIRCPFVIMATVCITSTLALSPATPAQPPSRAEIDRRAAAALALATAGVQPAQAATADDLSVAEMRDRLRAYDALIAITRTRPNSEWELRPLIEARAAMQKRLEAAAPVGSVARRGVYYPDASGQYVWVRDEDVPAVVGPAGMDAAGRQPLPAVPAAYYPPPQPVYYPAQAFGGWAGGFGGNCVNGRCH